MTRRLLASFLPLLAAGACLAAPVVAQAAPHWYVNSKLLTKKKERQNRSWADDRSDPWNHDHGQL